MSAAIEVVRLHRLDGTTSVKAFVDIKIGGVMVKGAKVIQQEGQRAWLGMPGVKTNHGWQNTVEIRSKDLRQRVTDIVLAAWERQA